MKAPRPVNRDLAKRVVEVVSCGLSNGIGKPAPGHMCVEAAVCYAMGLPHGDYPTCVNDEVRSYKIAINDLSWSSNAARARGLKRVAVAQLGSDAINGGMFERRVFGLLREHMLAEARAAARRASWDDFNHVLNRASSWLYERSASHAVRSIAEVMGRLLVPEDNYLKRRVEMYDKRAEVHDKIYTQAAELAVQALQELGSPGCQWLDLCEEN